MAGVAVNIAPEILDWVIQKVQFEDISSSISDMLNKWKSGEKVPTFNQIEALSKKTHIPFGYFFLDTPPEEECSIVEYRTVDSLELQNPSRNLIDTVDMMTNIQEWMREYLKDNSIDQLDFVGRYKNRLDANQIVENIREELGLDMEWFTNSKTPMDSFRYLRDLLENKGILVMMSGTVGLNTSCKLNVNEFRAFTLIDEYAPLIFINTCDSEAGKLFSLLHELVHIWIGENSFFNGQEADVEVKPMEQVCNAVAAELLVPISVFVVKWNEASADTIEKINNLSKYFSCSKNVITRKAFDKRYITKAEYETLTKEWIRQYQKWQEEQKAKKDSGGDFYRTLGSQLDHRFLRALETSAKEGKIQYTEVYRLTNTNRKTFDKLMQKIGGAK